MTVGAVNPICAIQMKTAVEMDIVKQEIVFAYPTTTFYRIAHILDVSTTFNIFKLLNLLSKRQFLEELGFIYAQLLFKFDFQGDQFLRKTMLCSQRYLTFVERAASTEYEKNMVSENDYS